MIKNIGADAESINYIEKWEKRIISNGYFYEYISLTCLTVDRMFVLASISTMEVERSFSSLNLICTKKRIKMSNNTFLR